MDFSFQLHFKVKRGHVYMDTNRKPVGLFLQIIMLYFTASFSSSKIVGISLNII